MTESTTIQTKTQNTSPWRITQYLCLGVVVLSFLSCIATAAYRSKGLTQVTVTALDSATEPRDHDLPLINQHDALPDYQLLVQLSNGGTTMLGTKLNTSAANGLTWTLNDPLPICGISSIRLQDQDMLSPDPITEVQVVSETVELDGYRFDFSTEYSASLGVESFYNTPIGLVISGAIFIAIFVMVVINARFMSV